MIRLLKKVKNIFSEYRNYANNEYNQKMNELLIYFNTINSYDLNTRSPFVVVT